MESAPIFAIGLFILPAFDTLRVFTLRLLNGKSPFLPDNNHIHHLLLKGGLNHMQATACLTMINVLFVVMAVRLQSLEPTLFLALALGVSALLSSMMQLGILARENTFRTDP